MVWVATLAAVAGSPVLAAINDAGPIGMLLGFAPHWWATLPWLVLVPLACATGRRTALVATAGALVTLFGVARCASTPKFPHLMNRQIPAVTGG